jgi:hypothetical protein
VALPDLETAIYNLTVEDLKWYAAFLPAKTPTRKAELVAQLKQLLLDPARLRQLWAQIPTNHQQAVSEVAHKLNGRYNGEVLRAKYPNVPVPQGPQSGYYGFLNSPGGKKYAAAYDMLFYRSADVGLCIPRDVLALLRDFVPEPPAARMRSHDERPGLPTKTRFVGFEPEIYVSETEQAIFHDLAATLHLVQQGKAGVSAATRLPSLATLRQLRQRLLIGDYLGDDYERAEDAIRPLALVMLVQAAKWATPSSSNKLELTKRGQALLGVQIGPQHIREAWESWAKTDLLDELSRIRAIRGQQAKGTRMIKPAERREKFAAALRDAPPGRWVELDDFFRYLRAQGRGLSVERTAETHLFLGSSQEYGWLGYSGVNYWDVVVGSFLRALLFEYVATLGMIDISYTVPEDTPHSFGEVYGLDEYEFLSRYDGLLALRLTGLGSYALGLTDAYTPPAPIVEAGAAVLKVLPNLDIVVTDAAAAMPNDRAFLERIAAVQSQDVYRLSRDLLLEAAASGLALGQVKAFLEIKSGQPLADFPQIVRVFFEDLEKRLGALREGGRMVMIEGDDTYLLTELANNSALRSLVQLATIGERSVLLVPEDQEAAVRRALKKLGYIPRKA